MADKKNLNLDNIEDSSQKSTPVLSVEQSKVETINTPADLKVLMRYFDPGDLVILAGEQSDPEAQWSHTLLNVHGVACGDQVGLYNASESANTSSEVSAIFQGTDLDVPSLVAEIRNRGYNFVVVENLKDSSTLEKALAQLKDAAVHAQVVIIVNLCATPAHSSGNKEYSLGHFDDVSDARVVDHLLLLSKPEKKSSIRFSRFSKRMKPIL